jgi:hypothetical protein
MPQTTNHGYNVPNKGDQNWHEPLNENFRQYDSDIEIRDEDANKGNYEPKQGAKFLATDTETVYVGDGSGWTELPSTGREPEVDALTCNNRIEADGINCVGAAVEDFVATTTLNKFGDNLGVGEPNPVTPLDVRSKNNYDLDNSDGDFSIGFEDNRLAMGVATGGNRAGNAAIRAKGGDSLKLGAGGSSGLTVKENLIRTPYLKFKTGGAIRWGEGSNVIRYDDSSGQYTFRNDRTGLLYLVDPNTTLFTDLDITGDLYVDGNKNFVQSVDTDDGEKEVVYTSTEAPTARTEATGVAELEDGRAEIDLPEHFGWVTDDEEPIHVQTTPHSADSGGLAAVERSTERLVVEDLDGDGDYEFAYTVKGTREGHADKQVVREPSTDPAEGPSPTPADD